MSAAITSSSPAAAQTTAANAAATAAPAVARREDIALITGHGRYTADHAYPGMLHAHVIRSTHAHARIARLDLQAVSSAPGVHWVMTSADALALGAQDLPNGFAVTDIDGQPQKVVRMPVLANDTVHFVGQPIALVIADSAALAQDAAELAEIDYDALDAVSDVDTALANGAPTLHVSAPGNLSARFANGDRVAVEAAFAGAAHVSRLRVASQRLIGMPMEPRAVVVMHDATSGRTRVHTPTQGMLGMLATLTALTGVPAEQIEIATKDVGGSFGLRGGAYSEHALLVLAARKLNRPLRWVGSRSEVILSDWHGRALVLDGQVALDAQGRILAIRFADQTDLGAYNCYFSTFIGAKNLCVTMGGVYQVPALYMESDMVFTNTTPVSAYRGAGRPDIAYAIERLIDHAAHEHGFDPVALRRRNFIPLGDFPYRTANGTLYDTCDCAQVMDRALTLADYDGFTQRRAQSQARGKLRGIGFATYLEISGTGGAAMDQVQGEFSADGRLQVYGVTGGSGQGHETSFQQIIEAELGLPILMVSYHAGDPSRSVVGNGTGGSRSLYGAGSAVKDLCARILALVRPLLAQRWGCDEAALGFANGQWTRTDQATQGESAASIDQPQSALSMVDFLASLSADELRGLRAVGEAKSGATFPNGCHVAEIEIDPRSGVTEVVNYVAVDDLGTVISPQLVEGQVHGGVVQGWGQAFCEHAVYDEGGQLLTGSLMDYAMPRLGCLPVMQRETLAVPTTLNLLGAKGVGESGCTGSLPALANAVIGALRPLGIQAMDMPFTPAKVWAAIQTASQTASHATSPGHSG